MNGLGMGLTTTAVLVLSNAMISLLRKMIPDKVRIPAFIVVVASFVTIVQFLLQAYFPSLNDALGLYIPLIVVNCIILGRAEAYASKNNVILSIFDGIGMGLGFTIGLTAIGLVRELIGSGEFFGRSVLPSSYEPATIFVLAPGAFFVLAFLTALQNKFKAPSATNIEGDTPIACGGGCATCGDSACAANHGILEAEKAAKKAEEAAKKKAAAEAAAKKKAEAAANAGKEE
jgi:electron transport complex protein RnfE